MASCSNKEDSVQAIVCEYEARPGDVNVINIRKMYGGTFAAIVLVQQHVADQIVAVGLLKDGILYCRTKICEKHVKCYRGLAVGHESRDCAGPRERNAVVNVEEIDTSQHSTAQTRQEAVEAFTRPI